MALRDSVPGPPNLHHKQIRDALDLIESLMQARRVTQAQIDAMVSPEEGVVFYNLTTHKMQFYDSTKWVVLGEGGGTVIGVPPGASVSWKSNTGITGSPVSAWESVDETVTLAQATGSKRPAVTASVFGSTQGLTFDGTDDHLTVATKVITINAAASISIVFKTGSTVAGPMVLVSQSNTAASNDWFEIGIGADSRMYVENNNAGTKHTVKGSLPLLPSTVYDMQLFYDGTDYFMMIGGVEENPLTVDNIGSFAWFGRVGGTSAFTVAGTLTSGGLQRPFNGVLGAIFFWSEDLTA